MNNETVERLATANSCMYSTLRELEWLLDRRATTPEANRALALTAVQRALQVVRDLAVTP